MDANSSASNLPPSSNRGGRGRGRGRGGLGKYLRARGRGRGGGRPAEFRQRLVLEGEETTELDEEDLKEIEQKFGKRKLVSNAERYKEPDPVLNSDGEVEEDPEVDLSEFLAKQRLDGEKKELPVGDEGDRDGDEEEIDESLAHLSSKFTSKSSTFKGKVQYVEWDESTERMFRDADAADANRELKSRFRAKVEKQRNSKPIIQTRAKANKDGALDVAPPLPTAEPKAEKEEMEDFLDDLLS